MDFKTKSVEFKGVLNKLIEHLPVEEQEDFRSALFISDKWVSILQAWRLELQQKMDQVKQNLNDLERIKENTERELKARR